MEARVDQPADDRRTGSAVDDIVGNAAILAALGEGPVHALDLCLRKCVSSMYPQLTQARLTDYKVRVLDSRNNTAAKVRVLVQWAGGGKSWSTVGVSNNIIEASWNALLDGARLDLIRLAQQDTSPKIAVGE